MERLGLDSERCGSFGWWYEIFRDDIAEWVEKVKVSCERSSGPLEKGQPGCWIAGA